VSASLAHPDRLRAASQRQRTTAVAHFRLMVMMLMFIGITSVIALRLGWLAVTSDGGRSTAPSNGLLPDRGDIVDRNGVPLATTIDAWSIAIHPTRCWGTRNCWPTGWPS
jgi:cell division protein FtsI (penicillin-binding protein 3)